MLKGSSPLLEGPAIHSTPLTLSHNAAVESRSETRNSASKQGGHMWGGNAKHFCAALVLACSAQPTWARIGETEEELKKRFGEPYHVNTKQIEVGDKQLFFTKGDIDVVATILNGRSVGEGYFFRLNGQPRTIEGDLLAKAAALVETNSQGQTWLKHPAPEQQNPEIKHCWIRSDQNAAAVIWKSKPDVLEVTLKSVQEETFRANQAGAAGVGGF